MPAWQRGNISSLCSHWSRCDAGHLFGTQAAVPPGKLDCSLPCKSTQQQMCWRILSTLLLPFLHSPTSSELRICHVLEMNLPLSIPFSTSEPGAEVQDTVLSQPFGWVGGSAQGWSRPQMGTTRARIAQQLPPLPSRKVFATRIQQLCVRQSDVTPWQGTGKFSQRRCSH